MMISVEKEKLTLWSLSIKILNNITLPLDSRLSCLQFSLAIKCYQILETKEDVNLTWY